MAVCILNFGDAPPVKCLDDVVVEFCFWWSYEPFHHNVASPLLCWALTVSRRILSQDHLL